MGRLKLCAGGDCNERSNGSIADSVLVPDLDEVFPVVEGTFLTDEEVLELGGRGVRVDRTKVVHPEEGVPRLPTAQVVLGGQSRHRGKPASTEESRRALEETAEEKRKIVEERKRKKEEEKAEEEMMNTRPKVRGGKTVHAVRKPNEGLEEVLMRSHDIRIEVRSDARVGEYQRVLTIGVRGSVYIVTLGEEPSCSCMVFKKMESARKRWKHCEHLYAIMYRGVQVREKFENTPVLLVHQPSFTKREAKRMCAANIDRVALDR